MMIMSEEEIEKGNILISEFMGNPKTFGYYTDKYGYHQVVDNAYIIKGFVNSNKHESTDEYDLFLLNELCYHSSWDWLMTVVEKIKDIADKDEDGRMEFSIKFELDFINGVQVWAQNKRLYFSTAFGEGQLIEAVYGGVIEFINWYNKQNI